MHANPPFHLCETRAVKKVIELYPRGLSLTESRGFYPLHIICQHFIAVNIYQPHLKPPIFDSGVEETKEFVVFV
jgi:hypothetical protein